MANSNLLTITSLSKIYRTGKEEVQALSDINLTIEKGEFVAFSGHSGSGKTTLLNLIGTLDSITKGDIVFNGGSLSSMTEKEKTLFRRLNLGFVFQSYNLIPVLTALENVLLAFQPLKKGEKESVGIKDERAAAVRALEDVGLGEYLSRKPGELSGGQQQRVSIARAVVRRPLLLLCDEPTANLDSRNSTMILDLLEKMNREYGITVICSSHDSDVLEKVRRIIILKDGKIVEDRRK